jgi:SAM-dependent methyltransferase
MADSYSSKLQLWEGWQFAAAGQPADPAAAAGPPGLYTSETLGPPQSPIPAADGIEPFSLQWFLHVETLRHHRHGRWIPSVLEFDKHGGETLLGVGTTLGTDWVQYARHGAAVVVCCPDGEHLPLVRRNFELRELPARYLPLANGHLSLETASIDVVCVVNHLQHLADARPFVDEVYRVLKPGGKVLAVVPARYDIDFWHRALSPWMLLRRRLASGEAVFTARSVRALFHRFVEHRVHKRHLRRADVPHLWRLLPSSMLQRLVGRTLILKAFKPLSAAIPAPPLAA